MFVNSPLAESLYSRATGNKKATSRWLIAGVGLIYAFTIISLYLSVFAETLLSYSYHFIKKRPLVSQGR